MRRFWMLGYGGSMISLLDSLGCHCAKLYRLFIGLSVEKTDLYGLQITAA